MRWRTVKKRVVKWAERRAADCLIVSVPGSGRTWLALMISRYYALTRGAPTDLFIKQRQFYRGLSGVPRFYLSHPSQIWRGQDPRGAAALHAGKPTVFLIRDPRDAAVSRYHHHLFRKDVHKGAAAPDGASSEPAGDALARFLLQEAGGLVSVVTSLRRIEAVAGLHANHLIVTYEGLRAEPAVGLSAVLRMVEREPDPVAVQRAVELCTFERMRAEERQGAIRAGALRPAVGGGVESFKTRQGAIGGYRSRISAEACAELDRRFAALVPPALQRIIERRQPVTTLPAAAS